MDRTEWERQKALFADAMDQPESQRAEFIHQAAENDAIKHEVLRMLRAHVAGGGLILRDDPSRSELSPGSPDTASPTSPVLVEAKPASPGTPIGVGRPFIDRLKPVAPDGDAFRHEALPSRIGPYRIVHQLGHGGMGIVLLGVRDDNQLSHRVAIKLIKRGMDTTEILRRFHSERQILSSLNHPNIVHIIDAGITTDGQSYFVMQFIDGESIDKYCDSQRLSIDERLRLFQKVCGAVHHAHQNLVVHRDLKPSNILIGKDGEPHLLDFGIAKLLNPEAYGVPVVTAPEVKLMTAEYASPEQVRGEVVSTATDVYSLGVILYGLLTGHPPYQLGSRVHDQVAKIICETEPEKPSTRVLKSETMEQPDGTSRILRPEDVAAAREGAPQRLCRRLSGDLDTIVLKAMHKSSRRRYQSAQQFAEDIQRHLDGMPVIARPDTFWYRSAKFARRNKGGVVAAVLVVGALVVGGGVAGWKWMEAEHDKKELTKAREDAVRAQKVAEDLEKEADHTKTLSQTANRQLVNLAAGILKNVWPQLNHLQGSLDAKSRLADTLEEVLEQVDQASIEQGADARDVFNLRIQLAQCYQAIAETKYSRRLNEHLNEPGDAIAYLEKALKQVEPLHTAEPTNAAALYVLGSIHLRFADAYRETPSSDAEVVDKHYRMAVEYASNAQFPDVGKERFARELHATALTSRGIYTLKDTDSLVNGDQAKAWLDQAVTIEQKLIRDAKANGNESDVASAFRNLAVTESAIGDARMAREEYREAAVRFAAALEHLRLALAGTAEEKKIQIKHDIVQAERKLGEAQTNIAGEGENARRHLQEAQRLEDELKSEKP